MKKNTSHRGFTIVELLVVITIIALLVSMLLPSLSQARKRAQDILCMSNTRQINAGLFPYVNDQKNLLPWCEDYPSRVTSLPSLISDNYLPATTMNTYNGPMQSNQALKCPSQNFHSGGPNYHSGGEYVATATPWRNGPGLPIISDGWDPREAEWASSLQYQALTFYVMSGINASSYGGTDLPLVSPIIPGPPYWTLDFTGRPRNRLDSCVHPSDTWIAADSSWCDWGIQGTVFRHSLNSANFAYLDGHSTGLKTSDVDGSIGNWVVSDARMSMSH